MEVFKSICEHVAGDEFEKNQMEFVFANCAKFDVDAEENKLEYDNIHKEYVHILEQLIEVKLKAKFSDDEVNEFYSSFGENAAEYEKVNSKVVDQLYNFIDFQKFKKTMIEAKTGFIERPKEEQSTIDETYKKLLQDMSGKQQEQFNDLLAEDVKDPKSGWHKTVDVPEKDGIQIQVYQRKLEGSSLDICRGDCWMRNVSTDIIKEFEMGYLDKYGHRFDKHKAIKEMKVLEYNEETKDVLMYQRFKMGLLANDREMLMHIKTYDVEAGKTLRIVYTANDRTDIEVAKDCVRAQIYDATFTEQVGNDIHMVKFQNMDLAGYFPARLMNMILSQGVKERYEITYEILNELKAAK